jgi:serine/threonine protein kinase/tetratricopeptide (TPR) repeat protein
MIGELLGHYRIESVLGTGGMGIVYRAHDTRLDRKVAIKVLTGLSPDSPPREALLREARAASHLNHPGICTIYEVGETADRVFMVMEIVEGDLLQDRIPAGGLPVETAIRYGTEIASAVAHAHEHGVIHRDLKSANVRITRDGRIKVLDFGLATRSLDVAADEATRASQKSSHGQIVGTLAYMAPEVLSGTLADERSDIWAEGVLLYEMLNGRLPFPGRSTFEMTASIIRDPPAPLDPRCPAPLARIVRRLLEKEPALRYQRSSELAAALEAVRPLVQDRLDRPVRPIHRFRPGDLRPWMIVTVAVLVFAAGLSWWAVRNRTPVASPVALDEPAVPEPVRRLAVGVMPFQYEGAKTSAFLGRLATDALVSALQRSPSLSVASQRTTAGLEGQPSVADVARRLALDRVVTGQVNEEGGTVVVAVRLFDASGKSLWENTYESSTERALDSVDEAQAGVQAALDAGSTRVAGNVNRIRTPSLTAYERYLEASELHQGFDIEGNTAGAIALYREALTADPDFAAAHAGLAVALVSEFHRTHDPQTKAAASEAAGRALRLDQELPEAWLASGMVAAESGETVEARAAFDRALALAPGNDATCRNIAELYASLGRHADAEAMFERALALRPGFWRHHYDFGTYLFRLKGDVDAAEREVRTAASLHQGPAPLVLLGIIRLTRSDLDGAERYLRQAQELSPLPATLYNLGLINYYRGQYDLALRNWRAVLESAPREPGYRAAVADALRQLGRLDESKRELTEAVEDFRKALDDNQQDDETRAELAMALAALGNCAEAQADAGTVLARHPKSPLLSYYGAITASRCGDDDRAAQLILSALPSRDALGVRFDPDLARVRQRPDVRAALARGLR